jgi:hypothetical protein
VRYYAVSLSGIVVSLPYIRYLNFILKKVGKLMKNTKFLVKVNRGGARAAEYVLRVDRSPIQTTTNRKLALAMGRFTAEDAIKSMQNSRCNPELVSVQI